MPEWSRNTPWRQGFLLPAEAIESIGLSHPESQTETLVIVATHDCDLTQLPDREPTIEVVVGRKIQNLEGNFTHAKNSRTLHIEFENNEPLLAEFSSTEKRIIPKNVLLNYEPESNASLSPAAKATFQAWLASRYRRSAFPDAFENRLKEAKLHEKITKAVKPLGNMITAVFFDVDEGREVARTEPDDVYALDIILLYATEPDFDAAEKAAESAKDAINRAFKAKLQDPQSGRWKYIELRYIDAISEEALSYRQAKLWKKWSLDYISLGADPQQPVLAE
jgi:hypothetical protein